MQSKMKIEAYDIFIVPQTKLQLFRPCQDTSDLVHIPYYKIVEFVNYPEFTMVFTTEGDFICDMSEDQIKKENQRVRDFTYCLN